MNLEEICVKTVSDVCECTPPSSPTEKAHSGLSNSVPLDNT